ncbi:hypothetical protein Emed_006389 [Eimeria media]
MAAAPQAPALCEGAFQFCLVHLNCIILNLCFDVCGLGPYNCVSSPVQAPKQSPPLRMRLCLLAVGALAGAPSLSCGFHAHAKAALMGMGSPMALMTDESPQASLSMHAPSVPSAFVTVSAPGLARLKPAQLSLRRIIAQRLAARAQAPAPATAEMMKKISSGAGGPTVPQPPSTVGRPPSLTPSVTPGAGAPPPPAAPAAGATPAARLLFRLGAVREEPSAEAPKKQLSPEELEAAKEAVAAQEEEFKKMIRRAVRANIAYAQQRKAALGERAEEPQRPVEREVMEALNIMTGARSGTKEVIIRNIREVMTGKRTLAECVGTQTKILGVGGMGVVLQVHILEESCKKALGMDQLALKVMYADLEGTAFRDKIGQRVYRNLLGLFQAEMKPLKLIGAVAKLGQSIQDMLKDSNWAVPAFSAYVGDPKKAFHHNGIVFTPYVLLSKLMLGDGFQLIKDRGRIPASPIPMPAREYVCGQMIKATAKLHAIGLAHYDIKPDNILVGPDGSINLADFGMCGLLNVSRPCGDGITPLFADPAQAACLQKEGELSMNPRYDSWSLGMTCYFLMTARGFPYRIRNLPLLLEHISSLISASKASIQRQRGDPERELKAAGASRMWARIVADLLIVPREKRPTPGEILIKYPNWTYGTD